MLHSRSTLALTAALLCLLLGAVGAWAQDPCEVVDNGTGTVTLPPDGCDYLSPDQYHEIVDGLPADTTIILKPIHRNFLCQELGQCGRPGGSLDGEVENFTSDLVLQMTGTGDLKDFNRTLVVRASCETHTGFREPGKPVQSFDTTMYSLTGEILDDPDFAELRVTAGDAFDHPSPGFTTLTDLGDGRFLVDSHFEINYVIDFVGAEGGSLAGMSGSTEGTVTMTAAKPCP